MKFITVLVVLIILGVALFSLFFSATIFQEGNPIPVAVGIIKISVTGGSYAKVNENKYIVKANDADVKQLTDYLAQHNVIYTDRAGSGYLFRDKQGKNYSVIERMYTISFEVFDFSNARKEGLVLP